MPIAHLCDPGLELTVSVWERGVEAREWHEHLRRLGLDPDFPNTWKHLVDMRFGFPVPSFDASAIQEGIDYMLRHRPLVAGNRVAFVTGVELKRIRLFQRLAEAAEVTAEVFSRHGDACTWLEVDSSLAAERIAAVREVLRRGEA